MNEIEKRFEMINGVIHYREYKFEMTKDTELSQEEYENKRKELLNKLEQVTVQLDELEDKQQQISSDLEVFNKFDQLTEFFGEDEEEVEELSDEEDNEEISDEEDNEEIISEPIVN